MQWKYTSKLLSGALEDCETDDTTGLHKLAASAAKRALDSAGVPVSKKRLICQPLPPSSPMVVLVSAKEDHDDQTPTTKHRQQQQNKVTGLETQLFTQNANFHEQFSELRKELLQEVYTLQQELATQNKQLAAQDQQLATQNKQLRTQQKWLSTYDFVAIRKLKEVGREQVCQILGANYEVQKNNWAGFLAEIPSNPMQQAILSAKGLSTGGLLATRPDEDQTTANDVVHQKGGSEEQIAIAVEMLPEPHPSREEAARSLCGAV
jgi:hypothetical protein